MLIDPLKSIFSISMFNVNSCIYIASAMSENGIALFTEDIVFSFFYDETEHILQDPLLSSSEKFDVSTTMFTL